MHDTLQIHFEIGRIWLPEELPARAIALDGAVQGPVMDLERQVFSFDHHAGCIRHATLSTCEQVRDALLVGFDPIGHTVYINDVDGDTVLALWLLQHPERLRGEGGARVRRMVTRLGRLDSLGPGYGSPHTLHRLLTLPAEVVRGPERLEEALALVDRWWRNEELPPPPPAPGSLGIWIEEGQVRTRRVEDGFRGLYQHADFGLVHAPAPAGTHAYTVGKRSEFVRFDVAAFLRACNLVEPGWGGGSTVGGAPRHADGRRSALPPARVGTILAEVVADAGSS